MANSWVTLMIVGVLATMVHSQAYQYTPKFIGSSTSTDYGSLSEDLPVFIKGKHQVTDPIKVPKKNTSPPEPLLVVSPKEAGVYPVLFFIHGTMLSNEDYSELFNHIASHGFIVVAPKLFRTFPPILPSQQEEIDRAASVANWLPSNLSKLLQKHNVDGVEGDFGKLAISGHSRGGKSAFALALGRTEKTGLTVKVSALIGVDPVAGISKKVRTKPYVLTYEPDSINLPIPVAVIGTGKGNQTIACAPNHVSHQQFFEECRDASHFVITEYGHMEMLNGFLWDIIGVSSSVLCAHSYIPNKAKMRRTLGGIMVAFLDTHFRHDRENYCAIIADHALAPTKLVVEKKGDSGCDPTLAPTKHVVEKKGNFGSTLAYAEA